MKQEHVVKEEASWKQIKQWDKLRGDMEASIARALRLKKDRLGEKKWLEECEKHMGWGRSAAYMHLNPEQMEKNRKNAAEHRSPYSMDKEEWQGVGVADLLPLKKTRAVTEADEEPEGPLDVDICFSHFVEAARELPAEKYLTEVRAQLEKKSNRRRFEAALIVAKRWIEEVLDGIKQHDEGDNK
jgi:hypothetical protein